MELIAELEGEKRGVYAGAVGYFGYGSVDGDKEIEGAMDVSGSAGDCLGQPIADCSVLDVHRAAHDGGQGWRRLSPGRRGHRLRLRSIRRVAGNHQQAWYVLLFWSFYS
jgi:hypothetical protein